MPFGITADLADRLDKQEELLREAVNALQDNAQSSALLMEITREAFNSSLTKDDLDEET